MRRGARPVMYLGIGVVVFGLAKIHAQFIGHYDFPGSSRLLWTAVFWLVLCVSAYGFGLPDLPRTRRHTLGASVGAAVAGGAGISFVQLFVGDALLPRFVVLGSMVVLPDWYRVCIWLSSGSRSRAEGRDRVLVVAAGEEAATLDLELHGNPERPASIVGHVEPHGERAHRNLAELAVSVGATVLVLDRAAQENPQVVGQAASLHAAGIRVRTLTLFYDEWLGKLPVSELERVSLLFDISEVHRARYVRAKRLLDVLVAVAGSVALVLLTPVVLIGNRVANRGPLLYRQERIGKADRPFTILKFRTMAPQPGGQLANEWTAEDDPRITPWGRVLRRTHLDELPQMVNILRGDLSMVGPRPEQPPYVRQLSEKLPFYGMRHLVRPGLTGWSQVKYGYAGSETDALQKLQYDFWYLRNQSLSTDLRIIGRTIRSVAGAGGR